MTRHIEFTKIKDKSNNYTLRRSGNVIKIIIG